MDWSKEKWYLGKNSLEMDLPVFANAAPIHCAKYFDSSDLCSPSEYIMATLGLVMPAGILDLFPPAPEAIVIARYLHLSLAWLWN